MNCMLRIWLVCMSISWVLKNEVNRFLRQILETEKKTLATYLAHFALIKVRLWQAHKMRGVEVMFSWTEIPSIVLGMEENLKYCSVLHLKRYYLDGFPFNRVFFAFQNTDNEVTFGPMKLKQKNLSVSNPLDYFWEGGGLEGDISGWIL